MIVDILLLKQIVLWTIEMLVTAADDAERVEHAKRVEDAETELAKKNDLEIR
jgi:hypothetical protein